MNRILLIAGREFMAYAKTVGFWLSLLALPFFAVVGGAVPLLIRSSEPVRAVALVEEGPEAAGLSVAVQDHLRLDAERREARAREASEAAARATGVPAEAQAQASGSVFDSLSSPRLRIVDTPAEITRAATVAEREAVTRELLSQDREGADRLDAVAFLTRTNGLPAARVWTARATDSEVEDFVRGALAGANRRAVFAQAGIDPGVVAETEAFRADVRAFSPKARDGEVSFRDQLPTIMGLAGGFLLWSLVLTGASILLNSVMEEKSNKILEVLLSSASPTEILAGKVLGVAMLTLTVLIAWGAIGLTSLGAFQPQWLASIGEVAFGDGMLFWFLAFMVGGYLMYAVLFAAIGAFCDTPRDAQTLMGPLMMVLIIPLFVMQMALRSPDAAAVQVLSWIPFFTPFLMMVRLPADPPMIEVVGSILGMFAFALLAVWVAGRAFRAGALSDVKLSWKTFATAIRGGGRG